MLEKIKRVVTGKEANFCTAISFRKKNKAKIPFWVTFWKISTKKLRLTQKNRRFKKRTKVSKCMKNKCAYNS